MKKIFLQNKNSKKGIWLSITLALFLILALFNNSFRESFFVIFSPFAKISHSVGDWLQSDIKKENYDLKTEIENLKIKLLSYQSLQKENEQIKSLFSRPSEDYEKKYILAAIVSRPPQSPYDIFLIDAGTEHDIRMGAAVMVHENVLLGFVTEVFPKTSKVKLISFPEEKTNVLINAVQGGVQVSAVAVGRGGENLEIKIPASIEIKSGDLIVTEGVFSWVAGVVEKVEINTSDPFQKIMFRLPVNLQYLKYVIVEN